MSKPQPMIRQVGVRFTEREHSEIVRLAALHDTNVPGLIRNAVALLKLHQSYADLAEVTQ